MMIRFFIKHWHCFVSWLYIFKYHSNAYGSYIIFITVILILLIHDITYALTVSTLWWLKAWHCDREIIDDLTFSLFLSTLSTVLYAVGSPPVAGPGHDSLLGILLELLAKINHHTVNYIAFISYKYCDFLN